MPLLTSGKIFARDQLTKVGLRYYKSDGSEDVEAFNHAVDQNAKMYDALFQYLSDKLVQATVVVSGNCTGTAITPPGAYTGTIIGSCVVQIL